MSKAKGTKAETKVVRFLRDRGITASRRALAGNKDVGDILVTPSMPSPDGRGDVIIEVKAGKQTANPNRKMLTEWLDQAWVESRNAGVPCVLVVVRYNRRLKDADCWFQYHDGDGIFTRSHLYLDEFADELMK